MIQLFLSASTVYLLNKNGQDIDQNRIKNTNKIQNKTTLKYQALLALQNHSQLQQYSKLPCVSEKL
ncbi:MAG: hypothetical protein RL497_1412 [Pseudomonadota bacterium]